MLASRAPSHVLHVICALDPDEPVPSIPSTSGVDTMYAARVQEVLAAAVHEELEAAEVQRRVHFFVRVRIGKPAEEILHLAREVGADLIIVGTHGLTGLARLLVGSTSEKIVREAGCSVEIARPKTYPSVALPLGVEAESAHREPYVPPHGYIYEDRRVSLQLPEWPLL